MKQNVITFSYIIIKIWWTLNLKTTKILKTSLKFKIEKRSPTVGQSCLVQVVTAALKQNDNTILRYQMAV